MEVVAVSFNKILKITDIICFFNNLVFAMPEFRDFKESLRVSTNQLHLSVFFTALKFLRMKFAERSFNNLEE